MATTPPTTGNAVIDAALQQMAATTDILAAGKVFADNVPGWITAAVNKAIAAGATAAQLQAVTDLAATMKTNSDAFAAAIAADTPAAATLALAKMKTP
jgi:hypothetical protein